MFIMQNWRPRKIGGLWPNQTDEWKLLGNIFHAFTVHYFVGDVICGQYSINNYTRHFYRLLLTSGCRACSLRCIIMIALL